MTCPALRLCSQPREPSRDNGQRGHQQQVGQAFARAASRELQAVSPPMAFEVSKGLLDLHALLVGSHNTARRPMSRRQRRCEQPGLASVFARSRLVGPFTSALAWATGSAPQRFDQVQVARVGVSTRQPAPAKIRRSLTRRPVERGRVAPSRCSIVGKLDHIPHSPNPVPTQRLHRFEPRPAKARIGDDDGQAVRGHHRGEVREKPSVNLRAVIVLQRMHLLVNRYCTPGTVRGAPGNGRPYRGDPSDET